MGKMGGLECLQFSVMMLSAAVHYCFSLPLARRNNGLSLWIYGLQFFFYSCSAYELGLQLAFQIEVLCMFLPFLLCCRRICLQAHDPTWAWFLGACGAASCGYTVSFSCKSAFTNG